MPDGEVGPSFDIDSIFGQVGNIATFPSAILGTVPFFSTIRQPLQKYLGVDIGKYLIGVYVSAAVFFSLKHIWKGFWPWASGLVTSTISIQKGTPAYEEVLGWVTEHIIDRRSRWADGARALVIPNGQTYSSNESDLFGFYGRSPALRTNYDERSMANRYRPDFVKSCWIPHFWPLRRIYFHRQKPDLQYVADEFAKQDVSFITLSCLGSSTQPLKDFVKKCHDSRILSSFGQTCFYKSTGSKWEHDPIKRPHRPIETVDIDHKERKDLVDDIANYLRPAQRRFYARRGIPYRRGYLFHGPPGTGKTSMSLALAGYFDLELYIINLAEFSEGDSGLMKLFQMLPEKCIVLLEDIDSAGISREKVVLKRLVEDEPKGTDDKDNSKPEQKLLKAVTLSGLLNTIDGVGAKEGRVVIMTTNDPDALDRALIRPGRVDREVYFGPVNKHMAKAIFKRMYTKDPEDYENPKQMLSDRLKEIGGLPEDVTITDFKEKFRQVFNNADELEQMAQAFADKIPKNTFTPAEIQGFILQTMEEPSKAVTNVGEWVAEMTGKREGGIKQTAGYDLKNKKKEKVNTDKVNSFDPAGPSDPALYRAFTPKGRPNTAQEREKQSNFAKEWGERIAKLSSPTDITEQGLSLNDILHDDPSTTDASEASGNGNEDLDSIIMDPESLRNLEDNPSSRSPIPSP